MVALDRQGDTMFAEKPTIASFLDAVDELDEARELLAGLAQVVLALKIADIADAESLALVAEVLAYLSLTVDAVNDQLASNR